MDRISLEVIGNALMSIAEEMGEALVRSSYSANIKERRDCSAALFNAAGELIAQAEHIPMHLGSLTGVVGETLKRYPRRSLQEGDVILANDPFSGGGTHLPDITAVSPVFDCNHLVAFVANIGHHADGSNNAVRSIHDEGLRISPIRIVEAGVVRQDILELLLLNFRVPDERRADLRAQFAANRLGASRVQRLFERYGTKTMLAAAVELLDYGERKARAAIGAVPDGVYSYRDVMDGYGAESDPIPVVATITVAGEHITVDFTGSGPQVPGDINAVWNATLASVYYALKALLDPSIPPNHGFHRAISVISPEGTIVRALPPAAVGWRTQTCQRIADVIFGAMASALPESVTAAGNGSNTAMAFVGIDPGTNRFYFYLETIGGGSGARHHKDGLDGVQVHITNTSNLPVEALEFEYPLLVEEYALVDRSGGHGAWRGGMGIRRTIRILGHEAVFLGHVERAFTQPWGLSGGGPGGTGHITLNPGTSAERELAPKVWGLHLFPGDVVRVETPGGGGYGDPAFRSAELMDQDEREGRYTTNDAR